MPLRGRNSYFFIYQDSLLFFLQEIFICFRFTYVHIPPSEPLSFIEIVDFRLFPEFVLYNLIGRSNSEFTVTFLMSIPSQTVTWNQALLTIFILNRTFLFGLLYICFQFTLIESILVIMHQKVNFI